MAIKYSNLREGVHRGFQPPIPFRRQLKHLLKNFYRGDLTSDEVGAWLEERGLWGAPEHVRLILQTKLKGSLIIRLGRAAIKKGGLLRLMDLWKEQVDWMLLFGGLSSGPRNKFHTIPFVKRVKQIEVKFIDTWERVDGCFMVGVPVVTREYCVRYEKGVEPAVEIYK